MEIPSELGGAVAPATMAGKMQDLGPITPDLVYGSSAYGVPLANQGGLRGQSQRLLSDEVEMQPAFPPEQAEGGGAALHSATQARQSGANAKLNSGGNQPTVTPLASNRLRLEPRLMPRCGRLGPKTHFPPSGPPPATQQPSRWLPLACYRFWCARGE
jgi:hypothetical protein